MVKPVLTHITKCTLDGLTCFAVFSCIASLAQANVSLVCESVQTCGVMKAWVTSARVLMRRKNVFLVYSFT